MSLVDDINAALRMMSRPDPYSKLGLDDAGQAPYWFGIWVNTVSNQPCQVAGTGIRWLGPATITLDPGSRSV